MTYHPHGYVPGDDEIARSGYKAFGPRRCSLVPTAAQFRAAARDMATGDPDEYAALAVEVAAYWGEDDEEVLAWWCV